MNSLVEKLPKLLNVSNLNWVAFNQIGPAIASIILIIACSYTLSEITWALVPDQPTKTAPQQRAFNPQRKPIQNYNNISDAHLFGVYQQNQKALPTTNAPDTRLNLVLKGILAATPAKFASAIISMGKNGQEDTYSIGDKVSSATIREIHADRVILRRSGKLETLRMPKDDHIDLTRSSSKSSRRVSPTTPGGVLSNIRKEILKNPTSFGKYAIPIPYNENGRLRGYKLQPQGDRSLFDSVGLDPNDVIIAVNGVGLNNPAKGLKALRSLQKAKSIEITVLRNGAEMPLHFDVP